MNTHTLTKATNRLQFRYADLNDAEIIYQWRLDKETLQQSFKTHEFSYQSHCRWYQQALNSTETIQLMVEQEHRVVGYIRLDKREHIVCSWMVSPKYRGKKIGKCMLASFTQHSATPLVAEIKPGNYASISIAEHAGFILKRKDKALSPSRLIYSYSPKPNHLIAKKNSKQENYLNLTGHTIVYFDDI